MTDRERWENFSIASAGYSLAFKHKKQIHYNKTQLEAAENFLIENIRYLTPRQKKVAVKTLKDLLINCNHNQERFKDIINTGFRSTEDLKFLSTTPPLVTLDGIFTGRKNEEGEAP